MGEGAMDMKRFWIMGTILNKFDLLVLKVNSHQFYDGILTNPLCSDDSYYYVKRQNHFDMLQSPYFPCCKISLLKPNSPKNKGILQNCSDTTLKRDHC